MLAHDPTLESWVAALRDEDPDARAEAAFALGEKADRRATVALLAALDTSRDAAFVAVGCRALGKLRDGRALAFLLRVARDRGTCALEALRALGQLRRAEALPVLMAALNDPRARRTAVIALARLGNPGIVRGRVLRFDAARGFGFVRARVGRPVFFHLRDWDHDGPPVVGQPVSFWRAGVDAKRFAVRVRPLPSRSSSVIHAGEPVEVDATVRWFDRARGYGFARRDDTGSDVLLLQKAIDEGTTLHARKRVTVRLVDTAQGARALRVFEKKEGAPRDPFTSIAS